MSDYQLPGDDELRHVLESANNIAVVGLSPKPARPSFQVAQFLQQRGYRIIPVRPAVASVLGETAYPDLASVPEQIDLVNVFLSPDRLGPIVDACIALKVPTLWLQLGVINPDEAKRAQQAGITVVMDRCTQREYQRLLEK